jgi:hypothetical protein
MGAHYEIFVRPAGGSQKLVSDVGHALGSPLRANPGSWDAEIAYAGALGRTKVQLSLSHGYEEDHGMRFEDYPIFIELRDIDHDSAREEMVARGLFEQLRRHGHALLLAFDLQRRVDAFDP